MSGDSVIHSDILVHWTGRDIECSAKSEDWWQVDRSDRARWRELQEKERAILVPRYLKRLKDILAYGLWMTDQDPPDFPGCRNAPKAACTCFTALKLSQSRTHARYYGRLGMGVKRPFLFRRGGRHVVYFANGGDWPARDEFLTLCAANLEHPAMHFFKPMNRVRLDYAYYSESEWRIVRTEPDNDGKVVNPHTNPPHGFLASLSKEEREKLRFLVPLDAWLAIIIYPTLLVKAEAHKDKEIRDLLLQVKSKGAISIERAAPPVEIDLDLCRHL